MRVYSIRGDHGKLVVSMYRGKFHIGTVEVNEFDCVTVFRGIENHAPIFVKYLQRAVVDGEGREIMY